MSAGWIITTDHVCEGDDNGVTGPSSYDGPTDATALPIKFRMYDDDGELYYEGRMNDGASEQFGLLDPLYAFGYGNAGCTRLDIFENGRWVTL